MIGKSERKDSILVPAISGDCPTMYAAALGQLRLLPDFESARTYIETSTRTQPEILVTTEIDWSWTRVLEHFNGVITDRGTRVSRAAEVMVIMNKPGVLGTKRGTKVLQPGSLVQIVCNGNEAMVYLVQKKLE